jgi:NTP pyrophosphatase (non-canonical NTP hydrolase)
VDIKQYEQEALRTESKDYTEVAERIFNNYGHLKFLLTQFVEISKDIDLMKKRIMYNKEVVIAGGVSETSVEECNSAANYARLMHGVIGIATEPAEIVEAVLKSFESNKSMDFVNLKEEVGDQLFYQNLILQESGSSFEEAADLNIAKLDARYPKGFTEHDAINRNLAVERSILEN